MRHGRLAALVGVLLGAAAVGLGVRGGCASAPRSVGLEVENGSRLLAVEPAESRQAAPAVAESVPIERSAVESEDGIRVVVVSESGQALEGAEVLDVTSSAVDGAEPIGRTDVDGVAVIPADLPRDSLLLVRCRGFCSIHVAAGESGAAGGDWPPAEIVARLHESVELAVRVCNLAGEAIEGARILARLVSLDGGVSASAISDASGRARIEVCPHGEALLNVEALGHAPAILPIECESLGVEARIEMRRFLIGVIVPPRTRLGKSITSASCCEYSIRTSDRVAIVDLDGEIKAYVDQKSREVARSRGFERADWIALVEQEHVEVPVRIAVAYAPAPGMRPTSGPLDFVPIRDLRPEFARILDEAIPDGRFGVVEIEFVDALGANCEGPDRWNLAWREDDRFGYRHRADPSAIPRAAVGAGSVTTFDLPKGTYRITTPSTFMWPPEFAPTEFTVAGGDRQIVRIERAPAETAARLRVNVVDGTGRSVSNAMVLVVRLQEKPVDGATGGTSHGAEKLNFGPSSSRTLRVHAGDYLLKAQVADWDGWSENTFVAVADDQEIEATLAVRPRVRKSE